MLNTLKKLVVEEQGQGLAEYGLILAGVAVVCILVIGLLGEQLKTLFTSVTDGLKPKS